MRAVSTPMIRWLASIWAASRNGRWSSSIAAVVSWAMAGRSSAVAGLQWMLMSVLA